MLGVLGAGDVNALRVILLYHFSNGIFINGGLEGGVTNMLKTLQGNNLRVFSVRSPNDPHPLVLTNRSTDPKNVKVQVIIE